MTPPFETRKIEQLARGVAISPAALVPFQEPGGPAQSIELSKILSKVIATGTIKETRAQLFADLAHAQHVVALVFADPTPAFSGWYRKVGASGAGNWTQFEKLSSTALAEVQDVVEEVLMARDIAVLAGDYKATLAEGEASVALGEVFAVATGDGSVKFYRKGAPSVEIFEPATSSSLAAPNGGLKVGHRSRTLRAKADDAPSVEDYGAVAAAVDNAVPIRARLEAAKQTFSITFQPSTAPTMDPRKSVALAEHHVVKSPLTVWSKTAVVAVQGLNSGITLADDATGDALFLIGGSTNMPAWCNQVTIDGGAYGVLKPGAAFIRAHPDIVEPAVLGDSFITNLTVRNISLNASQGIMLGKHYLQSCVFENIRIGGNAQTIFHGNGHHLVFRNIDKTGFTDLLSNSALPLFKIGDPTLVSGQELNPTTNVLMENVILDLNGNPAKDSWLFENAKTVALISCHHEMFSFNRALVLKGCPEAIIQRTPFVDNRQDATIFMERSNLQIDLWQSAIAKDWTKAFDIDAASTLSIDTLRVFTDGIIPIREGFNALIKAVERRSVGLSVDRVYVSGGPANLIADPTFQGGIAGFGTGGPAGVPVLSNLTGNKVDPFGKILRVTYPQNANGFSYVFIPMPVFSGRRIQFGLYGEIVPGGGVDASISWMGVAEADSTIDHGRIYTDPGFCLSVGPSIVEPGTLVIGIANPRANTAYDIHMVIASPGNALCLDVPTRKAAPIVAPNGGAVVDVEARAALLALQNSLKSAGMMA